MAEFWWMVLCGFVGERQKDIGNGDEREERETKILILFY